MNEFLNIDTPENVGFTYEIAGIGSRFMAALIDHLILGIAQVVLILGAFFFSADGFAGLIEGESTGVLLATAILIIFVLNWGYFIFFEINWNGQTPGKSQIGLRTIGLNGLPATAGAIVIRNLVRAIDLLPISYGIGLVTMFINPQFRRLGDLAGGTIVVFDETAISLEQVNLRNRALGAPVTVSEAVREMPVERLSQRDVERVERFLQRQYELVDRHDVARQILKNLYQKMDLDWHPERFTMTIAVQQLQEIYQRMTTNE